MPDLSTGPSSSPPARAGDPVWVDVWDAPLRLLHWAMAAAVLIAYFSANVFDTVHEIAGYTVLALVVLRIAWGFAGTRHSRFRNSVRPPRVVLRFLGQIVRRQPGRYLGLNPAGAAMAIVLLALLAISAVSGWMQITERFFGVDWVETVHTVSSNAVLILAVVHFLGVVVMCALQRENLVRAMITGKKRQRAE